MPVARALPLSHADGKQNSTVYAAVGARARGGSGKSGGADAHGHRIARSASETSRVCQTPRPSSAATCLQLVRSHDCWRPHGWRPHCVCHHIAHHIALFLSPPQSARRIVVRPSTPRRGRNQVRPGTVPEQFWPRGALSPLASLCVCVVCVCVCVVVSCISK